MAAVYRSSTRARVRLRRRGAARALEIDGTFASFWQPGSPCTGSVWDALAAPVLALPPERRRRVLLLGVGGGSAARLLRALAPTARITGVEIDAEVVAAAKRWFALDELGIELVCADARAFLARSHGRYDLVVEDIFVGRGRSVRKPDWLPDPGLCQAARRVAPGGLLVTNALDDAPRTRRTLARLARSLVEIEVDGYDNRVLVASGAAHDARGLRRALAGHPLVAATLPRLRLRTRPAGGRVRARGTA